MINHLFILIAAVFSVSAQQNDDLKMELINGYVSNSVNYSWADTIPVRQDTIPAPADTLLLDLIPEFPDTIPADTLGQPDAEPEEEEEDLEIVDVWPDLKTPGFNTHDTDSTLRWDLVLNWADRYYRQPGVITYRTGRLGHPSGLDIHSYENRHQRLTLNELDLTDPVTGQTNWNRVPTHKIRQVEIDDNSYLHRSRVSLREHYVVQPRTFLNFDEGQDDQRNLEFAFTHNFSASTNVELSFWDRRDGNLFPRNRMEGRQIVGRVRHHLNDRLKLKLGYINNSLDQQQPFGYNIPDLNFFDFNPFNVTAVESNASSDHSSNDIYLQLLQRPNTEEPTRRAAGISYQSDNWNLRHSADTTAYSVRDVGAFAWQEIRSGDSQIRASVNGHLLSDRSGESLTSGSWIEWNTGIDGNLAIASWLSTQFSAYYRGRNDGRTGYELSGSLNLQPAGWLRLKGFGGTGSTIPDLQSLYWNSVEFRGNPFLSNETAIFMGGSVELDLGSIFTIGARGDLREVSDGIFIDQGNTFVNIDSYTSLSSSAWLSLNSTRFEGDVSASFREFSSGSENLVNQRLDLSGTRMWLKGSLYWKNSIFEDAAFIKAGVAGMFTPGNYIPAEFLVPLNRWQHGRAQRSIPEFHRLDVEVMTRIRWFMVQIRWENVLDAITQPGYFEADGYPMPRSRLMVGFRIVFTN